MVTYYIIPNYIINYFIWRRERTEYSSRSMRCLELSFYPQPCLHGAWDHRLYRAALSSWIRILSDGRLLCFTHDSWLPHKLPLSITLPFYYMHISKTVGGGDGQRRKLRPSTWWLERYQLKAPAALSQELSLVPSTQLRQFTTT